MVFRTLVKFSAGKRVPLIKFRKGGNAQPGGPVAANQASGPGNNKAASSAIEDWELPARYSRKPIDAQEMAYINNGGPV